MRIAVLGTGAVGGYFGGCLAQAGEEVTFIARGAHLEAMLAGGLRVESVRGDFKVAPTTATDDPRRVGMVDYILVGVKAWQVPEAASLMAPLVGPETCVVPLQNGVDAPGQLAAVLGARPVLGGLCRISAYIAAPGVIRHVGIDPYIAFGELDGRPSPRAERLLAAFQKAGVNAEVPVDIWAAMWTKFVFIAALSGLGGITRAPVGIFRQVPETREILEQCLQEIAAVAWARRVALPGDIVAKTLATIDNLPEATVASMARDLMEGRPSELGTQNGALVRMGLENGVPVPVNSYIYASLLPQELQARGELATSS